MTRDDALALADRILALVNSKPATPSREEIAEALWQHWRPGHHQFVGFVKDLQGSGCDDGGIPLSPEDVVEVKAMLGRSAKWVGGFEVATGCHIIQDTIYNPWDGRGLDLFCKDHGHRFTVKTDVGQLNVPTPARCPKAE